MQMSSVGNDLELFKQFLQAKNSLQYLAIVSIVIYDVT
jgi:hypothetical protein